MSLETVYQKIDNNERISESDALMLLRDAPWLKIAQLASTQRNRFVDQNIASYTVFAIINYTNICSISCSFCSFKREKSKSGAYVLSETDVFKKIEYALTQQADQIFLQGGVHPDLGFDYYTNLLSKIKERYKVHIRGFSPVEIKHLSELSGQSVPDTISTLKSAGLGSVPGAGAEILSERVRKILSPLKCTVQEWCSILKECHQQGLHGSANIVFGSIESDEEIIHHLDQVRQIQDEANGFNSFIPWTFQAQTKDFKVRTIYHHDYLKVLGICRIFLDNIKNIEVSVMVLGKDIGKLALHMGANDISSPVIEENVLRSFGVKNESESIKLIQEAGLIPYRRDFNYEVFSKKN